MLNINEGYPRGELWRQVLRRIMLWALRQPFCRRDSMNKWEE